ncbi:MAG: hypothetical protein ACT4OL_12620 [Nitrospiraceae bacterium]
MFLQTVSDRSYVAAHPIKLDETTVASILRGVHTEEKLGFTLLLGKALKSYESSNRPAFSEDDIALLTPYLTAALARATPNQRVGFRLYYPADIPTRSRKGSVETTEGQLFAQGQSLHFTLTLYRYMSGKPGIAEKVDKEPRPLPDSDGLRDFDVKFLPESALRQENYERSGWFDKSDDRTLVIDYQLLAKLLATPPEPAHTATPPAAKPVQPASTMPEPSRKSDPELQALKEEMKALQKKMDEQSAELQKLKKPPQKKKSSP